MGKQDDIVIVSAVRTPFSKFDSAMADIASIDLAVMVMKEVIKRVGVKPEEVDEINYGSCGGNGFGDGYPCTSGFPACRIPAGEHLRDSG